MLSIKRLVLVAIIVITSHLRGSEPTVELKFQNQNGIFMVEIPTASVREFVAQPAVPFRELKPVLVSSSGELKYRLSGRTLDDVGGKKASVRKSSIVERFERQSALVVDEIKANCCLSHNQLAKIELAASGECVRLQRLLARLDTLTLGPEDVSPVGFQRLCEEVSNVNATIAKGPLRDDSLLYNICGKTLEEGQKSALRIFYLQPLLKILRDKDMTSERMQVHQLEQYIGEENVDPFQLRNNYGQQYEAVLGLGEKKLASIFQPAQLGALNLLGRSEYRISLSISKHIKSAPVLDN